MNHATPKAERTKARLIATATAQLIEGNGQLYLNSVAHAAGVAPSVISHHFGSRAGLVEAVIHQYYDKLHADAWNLDLTEYGAWPVRERLRVRLTLACMASDPLTPIMCGALSSDPAAAVTEVKRMGRIVSDAAKNIRRGQLDGELPASVVPEVAGALIFGAIRQVALVAFTGTTRYPQEILGDHIWRVVLGAVGLPLPAAESAGADCVTVGHDLRLDLRTNHNTGELS